MAYYSLPMSPLSSSSHQNPLSLTKWCPDRTNKVQKTSFQANSSKSPLRMETGTRSHVESGSPAASARESYLRASPPTSSTRTTLASLLPSPHTQGTRPLRGSPGAPSFPPRGCSQPRRAALLRQEEASGQRIGFPTCRGSWASKPQAELLAGRERQGLGRSRGP